MSELGYQQYHQKLLAQLAEHIRTNPPFNHAEPDDIDRAFLSKLDELLQHSKPVQELVGIGQWLLTTIVSRYHHITPLVPRPLFWYFGGDCLHFLVDEEIHYYQQLEEAFHDALEGSGEVLDYERLMHSLDPEGQSHLH